jgi:hypothetical protein
MMIMNLIKEQKIAKLMMKTPMKNKFKMIF